MASKNASASSPVSARIASASAGEVSGPVAMMTLSHSGGSAAISVAVDFDQRLGFERGGDRGGKTVAIDGERAAGRQLVGIGGVHHQRAEPAHLGMQEADGAALGVIGAERVRTNQFGELSGLMHGGRAHRGRISCSTTGTPRRAICQAASEPARPPPMT